MAAVSVKRFTRHFRKKKGNWTELTFAKTSGIVLGTRRSAIGQFVYAVPRNTP